jgi:periplasmic protein TonB
MTLAAPPIDVETTRQLVTRWATAALCVAALHVGTVYAVTHWPRPQLATGEPPAAVMVELAPMPAAPEVPQQEVAVGEESQMSEQATPSEQKQEQPVEPDKAEPLPEPKPVTENLPEPLQPQTPTDLPKLAEVPNAEAVLPMPSQEPPVEKKPEEKPPEPVKPKEQEASKPQPEAKKAQKVTSAPKPVVAPKAKANVAPSSGEAFSMSMATWRGSVIAHLNRNKRSPGGSRGVATVAFSIDRGGRVISARLVRSSGSAALDAEAVALVRRASPVPPPPSNVKGGSILLSAPVRVSR